LLPILFGELLATSLSKLHLNPEAALLLMIAIIVDELANIPVKLIAFADCAALSRNEAFDTGQALVQSRRTPEIRWHSASSSSWVVTSPAIGFGARGR
jgi:hypothetical protein